MSFKPTEEQQEIIDAFNTGEHLVVQAGAGTGKTSTIGLIAEQMAMDEFRGVYLAFNKSIVNDVKESLSPEARRSLMVMTFHSLAYKMARSLPQFAELMEKFGDNDNTLPHAEIARMMKVSKGFPYKKDDGEQKYISPAGLISAALVAVSNYCQSDSYGVVSEHVRQPMTMPNEVYPLYASRIVPLAQKIWDRDITQPDGKIRFGHDHYLKLVSLGKPDILDFLGLDDYAPIFFDEAQDARPAMSSMLRHQATSSDVTPCQLVCVGDSSQAIYGSFTGAVDSLPSFSGIDETNTLPLTTSWRFGSNIAGVANGLLDVLRAPIRLVGNPQKNSSVYLCENSLDEESIKRVDTTFGLKTVNTRIRGVDAVLCRTNSELVVHADRLMKDDKKVFITSNKDYLYDLIADYNAIRRGDWSRNVPDMRDFRDFNELKTFLEKKDVPLQYASLQSTLRFMERIGMQSVKNTLDNTEKSEKTADVVISTIHKSKGLQWDRVLIGSPGSEMVPGASKKYDESYITKEGNLSFLGREAVMLLYVAATRARKELYIPGAMACEIQELIEKMNPRSEFKFVDFTANMKIPSGK